MTTLIKCAVKLKCCTRSSTIYVYIGPYVRFLYFCETGPTNIYLLQFRLAGIVYICCVKNLKVQHMIFHTTQFFQFFPFLEYSDCNHTQAHNYS